MALAVTKQFEKWDGKVLRVWFAVVASGSYPTGGDTLNFTGLGIHSSLAPIWAEIQGISGFGYNYVFGSPASQANGKMKVFVEATVATNTPLAEHTAATYVAGVTGDAIVGYADFLIR